MALRKLALAAVMAAGVGLLAAGPQPIGIGAAQAACDPGVKVDGSTAVDAKKKFAAAGYKQVKDLKKSCDSYWHGTATKDGAQVNVVVSPKGDVLQEGN